DEPTSSLTSHEAEQLFNVVKDLRSRGISIVYISHRLGGGKGVARPVDVVFVLRDGKNAGELPREQVDHERMVRMMVGRELSQFYQRKPHAPGGPALEVTDLRTPAHPRQQVRFTL